MAKKAATTPEPSPLQKLVLEAIAATPSAGNRTIAQALHRQNPAIFTTIERARTLVRAARGNHGEKSRTRYVDRGVRRPNGKAGWKPSLPPSHSKPWTPVKIAGVSKLLVMSDIHIPYHDQRAVMAAVKSGQEHGCDGIIINGDLLDFYSISRFSNDPKRMKAADELKLAAEFLLWLNEQFPNAKKWLKEGNHDERWQKHVWEASAILYQIEHLSLASCLAIEMSRLENGGDETEPFFLDLRCFGWEYIAEKRLAMAGKLPILHGHELPTNNSVSPSRGAFLRTTHAVLIGHQHTPSMYPNIDMMGGEIVTWSTGCLCELNPQYMPINKWSHGWAIVDIEPDGEFSMHNWRMNRQGKVRPS